VSAPRPGFSDPRKKKARRRVFDKSDLLDVSALGDRRFTRTGTISSRRVKKTSESACASEPDKTSKIERKVLADKFRKERMYSPKGRLKYMH
jgi:hypothetical protein